jgi:hypothetical protein
LGSSSPFVVVGRPLDSEKVVEGIHAIVHIEEPREAILAASHGVLCLRDRHLLDAWSEALEQSYLSGRGVHVVLCGEAGRRESGVETAIHISDVASRSPDELRWMVIEYFMDAQELLEAPSAASPEELDWVVTHSAGSCSEVLAGTLRLTSLRTLRSLSQAADLLKMPRASLRAWLADRGALPFEVADLSDDSN